MILILYSKYEKIKFDNIIYNVQYHPHIISEITLLSDFLNKLNMNLNL